MHRDLFDEEHELFRRSFRRWLDKEVVPNYLEWEDAQIVPRDVFLAAGEHGFLGMAIPTEHGGGGNDDFRYNLVIGEEIQAAAVNAAGLGITLHNDICLPYFLRYCDEGQRRHDHFSARFNSGDEQREMKSGRPARACDGGSHGEALRDGVFKSRHERTGG